MNPHPPDDTGDLPPDEFWAQVYAAAHAAITERLTAGEARKDTT